jgi:hypothetical protein
MANATDLPDGQRLFTVTYDGEPRWVVRARNAADAVTMCKAALTPADRSTRPGGRSGPWNVARLQAREPTDWERRRFLSEVRFRSEVEKNRRR